MQISTSEASADDQRKRDIRDRALAMGFDAVGFAPVDLPERISEGLDRFVARGAHGDMDWMARRHAERRQPRALWPDARSVISLAVNYAPNGDPLDVLGARDSGAISVYARGDDYHDVLKKRLKALGRWISSYLACEVKIFVDTAPVLEKPVAARAGLGWQGKHTNLVSRDFGSWLFLGEVFVAADLPADAVHEDRCGTCHACLDACPTEAFPSPYQLDARRCISYLTIEHKGHIPSEFREAMGNRIYGCDDCLAACPWNRFARASRELALSAREALRAPKLAELVELDDATFRSLFRKSPIKRVGRDRFVRNVLIAIGNSGDRSLRNLAVDRMTDNAPLVRAMAVWAVGRLATSSEFEALRQRFASAEADEAVLSEWRRGER